MAERTQQASNAPRPPVDLTERQRAVLRAVVEDYVLTAVPVGSAALVQRYGLSVSPATIRSAMADLERATASQHRRMLEQAIAAIDEQLAALNG